MILSRGRKYLFVHIPKTGGTSMALALEGRAMKDDIMLGDTPKALRRRGKVKDVASRGRLWKHSTLRDLEGLVQPDEVPGLFVFTLVRNPWDRMVSYYHWLRGQGFDHPAVALAKSTDFTGFVSDPVTLGSHRASPASSYVTDAQGVEHCQAFIRIEHFAQDAVPLWDHLGFALELPHENRTGKKQETAAHYSAVTVQLVAEACAEDIARFGYSFPR